VQMNALELMRQFVRKFPEADILSELSIDYTDNVPNCAGLFPGGLVEISRSTDLLGEVTVTNQYNFVLYTVLSKSADEDEGASYNAEWQMRFQEWVQAMSIAGRVPTFGDDPRRERIAAQNGAIYSAQDEGTAVYAIQLSVTFVKIYEKGW